MIARGNAIQKQSAFSWIYWILFLGFLISIVFSFRAVSSSSIGLILITAIIEKGFSFRGYFQNKPVWFFIAAGTIYFLIQFAVCLITEDPALSERMQLQSGLIFIPLAVYFSTFINKETAHGLLFAFALFLTIAGLYCLVRATIEYQQLKETDIFFYHHLVKWVAGHAVYYSIYVFISIVFLMESLKQRRMLLPKSFYIIFTFFLISFLILLSSRLIIAMLCLYLLYFVYSLFRNNRRRKRFAIILFLLAIVNAALIISSDNPVKKRFTDLEGRLDVVTKDRNSPADYLNGFQFRLLQWKLVPQILAEKDKWVTGVGLSNAQLELNRKYAERNMYLGDAVNNTGYQAYNTHNQFLQALLQTGIIGLIAFILVCIALLNLALKKGSIMHLFITGIILIYCGVESLLETQYGIVIFCFFPFLLFLSQEDSKGKKLNPG